MSVQETASAPAFTRDEDGWKVDMVATLAPGFVEPLLNYLQSLPDDESDVRREPDPELPHDLAYSHELNSALEHAVRQLPDALREAFLMHQVHQLADGDIAQALDVAPASVRVYLHRARQMLYEKLRPLLDDYKENTTDD